jgi:3-keto-disaccharide hydrolase
VKVKPLQIVILFSIMMILFVSACGSPTVTTVGVAYTLPFAPVTFILDSSGTISVQGNIGIETPIGTFGVEVTIADKLQPEDNVLLLIIRHKHNGKVVDDVYKIQTGQDEVRVVTNGTTIIDVTQHKVFIDASEGAIQSIEVQDANSQSTSTNSSPIPAPTTIPTPTPTPEPRLYRADWSNGLGGWMASDNTWHAINGILVNDGNQQDYNVDGNPTIIAPYPPADIANYSVQADIRLDRYTDEGQGGVATFGIVVRYSDGSGGYKFGSCTVAGLLVDCNGSDSPDYELLLSDGEFYHDAPIIKVPFRPNYAVWHTYRIDVQGNTLTAWLDGQKVFQGTNDKYLSAGQVGLWSYRCQLSIRSFTITAL